MIGNTKKRVLFFRDYRGFTGGHLKYWHYLNHTKAHDGYSVRLYMTDRSVIDSNIAWDLSADTCDSWHPLDTDILFVAGVDWQQIPTDFPLSIPVINLIQHVRHAESD